MKGAFEYNYFERWAFAKKGGTAEFYFVPLNVMAFFIYVKPLGCYSRWVFLAVNKTVRNISQGSLKFFIKWRINIK